VRPGIVKGSLRDGIGGTTPRSWRVSRVLDPAGRDRRRMGLAGKPEDGSTCLTCPLQHVSFVLNRLDMPAPPGLQAALLQRRSGPATAQLRGYRSPAGQGVPLASRRPGRAAAGASWQPAARLAAGAVSRAPGAR
jgi:hypothetical protein